MGRVKYFVSAPDTVKKVAEQFRKNLKKKKKSRSYKNLRKLKNVKNIKKVPECKFVLVFCPIVSRTGTDIDAKLHEIDRDFKDKSVILIVLHHTFDPERIVSDSSKFVKRGNTLTLDVLFHEDKGLLECERKSKALKDAANWIHLEIQGAKDSTEKEDKKQKKKIKRRIL